MVGPNEIYDLVVWETVPYDKCKVAKFKKKSMLNMIKEIIELYKINIFFVPIFWLIYMFNYYIIKIF